MNVPVACVAAVLTAEKSTEPVEPTAPSVNVSVPLAWTPLPEPDGIAVLVIWAVVAAAVMSTLTATSGRSRRGWPGQSSGRSTVLKSVPAVVMKSKLPSSKRRPWNVVVWAMRFKASSDESICNWLAAI